MNATPDFPYEKFHCVRCGKCCRWRGVVRVSDEEIDSIAQALGMTPEEFIQKMTVLLPDRSGLSIGEAEDGACLLYDDTGKRCIVNEVKPSQCRAFPSEWNFPGWEDQCEGGKIVKQQMTSGDQP